MVPRHEELKPHAVKLLNYTQKKFAGASAGAGGWTTSRACNTDSAIFCNIFCQLLIGLPVVCNREHLLVVCESRDYDQSYSRQLRLAQIFVTSMTSLIYILTFNTIAQL